MRIAIVNNCVPFVAGGAEYLAEALERKLIEHGHSAIRVNIPFRWHPPEAVVESMVACRLLRLPNTDLSICLKFPAYYLPHGNKVLWLLHQFRQAYDLWGTPYQDLPGGERGERIREAVIAADNTYLREARAIYTISDVVTDRLQKFNGVPSQVLYPPLPRADHLRNTGYGDYVFYPSRITRGKRQHLAIEAARYLKSATRVVIAGKPETAADLAALQAAIERNGLSNRVTLMPDYISEEQKSELFANALACVFPPYDEDYGYVALEAAECRKPTITCADSGGALMLVVDRETGRIVPPEPEQLAAAIDELSENPACAAEWGQAAYERMIRLGIHWDNVIERLTA